MLKIFSLILVLNLSLFANEDACSHTIDLLFFAYMSALIIYNFLFFLYLRDKTFIYYLLFQVTISIFLFFYSSLDEIYLLDQYKNFGKFVYKYFDSLSIIFSLIFAKNFFANELKSKVIDINVKISVSILLVCIIISPLYFLEHYAQLYVLFTLATLLIISVKKSLNYSKLFILSWMFLIIASIYVIFFDTNNKVFLYVGVILEATLFSLIIAHRMQKLLLNELYLKELKHRTKNNLQIISAYITFAQLKSKNDSKKEFEFLNSKIKNISLIEDSLNTNISPSTYINKMAENIFSLSKKRVDFNIDADNFILDKDTFYNIAIILNELLTNSFKHAFNKTKEPKIYITLTNSFLQYKDNGSKTQESELEFGFGFELIKELSHKKLNAKFIPSANDNLYDFKIIFGSLND